MRAICWEKVGDVSEEESNDGALLVNPYAKMENTGYPSVTQEKGNTKNKPTPCDCNFVKKALKVIKDEAISSVPCSRKGSQDPSTASPLGKFDDEGPLEALPACGAAPSWHVIWIRQGLLLHSYHSFVPSRGVMQV